MTDNIKIFLEGKDIQFIKDYLNYLGKSISDDNLVETGGFEKLFSDDYRTMLTQNTFSNGTNLIIFDADFKENEGGFKPRKQYLEAKRKEFDLDFVLFLFPNDKGDGDLEELLENISSTTNKPIYDCLNAYEKCIEAKGYHLKFRDNRKSRLHAYMSAIPKKNNDAREKFKRDFGKGIYDLENQDYWVIDSPYLNPLKDFLLPYFS